MPPRNLADPDYEPSDEDLNELMQRAFAHVPADSERLRASSRAEIAKQRAVVLAWLRDLGR